MTKEEIINEFKQRYLNSKTNNYIFTNIDDFTILDMIPNICSVSMDDSNLDIDYAFNIKIDLNEIDVHDILTYTLEELKKQKLVDPFFDYKLDFNSKFDLLKFQNTLYNYRRIVQLIFYNVESLSNEEQYLFNELYYFNCQFFNVSTFTKNDNLNSYFLRQDRVLDNRENYTKIKLTNRSIYVNFTEDNKVIEKTLKRI